MYDAALRSAVWRLVEPIVAPLPLIWAEQNAPRPTPPFLALRLATAKPSENDTHGEINADGAREVDNQMAATLEVQAFGFDAGDIVGALAQRLRFDEHVARACELGIAVGRRLSLRNLTALLAGSQFEGRGLLEVEILFTHRDLERVGRIQRVVVGGELHAGTRLLPVPDQTIPEETP